MRFCFADQPKDSVDFWGLSDAQFHTVLLKKGYCIGWSTSEVERLLFWAKEAFFVLRAKKYTGDVFIDICIAAAKGDDVKMIFGGDTINLEPLHFHI